MRARLALLIVVGCGEGPGSLPDAPGDDAIDAVDAGEALITVTITERGLPAIGATVYFQNPDSSLIRTTTTDIDGSARAPVPEGGYVTVIEPRPSAFGVVVIRDRLSTFAGVKPGDELHLDLLPVPDPSSINLEVTIASDPGAESYELRTSCGRAQLSPEVATTPASVTLAGCGGVADMLAVSLDATGQARRSIYRPAQPVSEGALISFAAPYVDLVPVTATISASPAWVRNVVVELAVASPLGVVFSGFGALEPPTTATMIPLPSLPVATAILRADVFPVQPAVSRQTVLAWGLPIASLTLDVTAAALRPIATAPTFDPATRTVTWTDEAGRDPDAVRAELYTYREGDPAHAWTWQMVAPHDRPAVTFPVLQGDAAAAFTTLPGDSFAVAELETLAIDGGYDRIRPHALRQAVDAVPPGAAGQLTYQRMYDENLLARPTLRPSATFTRATR